MIQKIFFISNNQRKELSVSLDRNQLILPISENFDTSSRFYFEIYFQINITNIRNSNSNWISVPKNFISDSYSTKILKLASGQLVQANLSKGYWEVSSKKPNVLYWHFNPELSNPITNYIDSENKKQISNANSAVDFFVLPSLLFPKFEAIEISKSKIPFSAVVCFTDHCDFDTEENLKVQRDFFKKIKLKITKGFFLNHFSKREDNASFEKQKEELLKWQSDGHELAYHSLSQSIKSLEESDSDFQNFQPPFPVPVWIDHGYQPYNLSLYQNDFLSHSEYESILSRTNIQFLWNYIDSGTATKGVINQLNSNQFNLGSFAKGISKKNYIAFFQEIIKAIVFHYYNSEELIFKYKQSAFLFKKFFFQKKFTLLHKFFIRFISVFLPVVKVFLTWNSVKNKPFKLSKFTPLFFKHKIQNKEFIIFQTLEIINFESALSPENIDLLIRENGVFIGHTYFSDSIDYHTGRFLLAGNKINPKVESNFKYLSERIQVGAIWNPTLSEFYDYLKDLEQVYFSIDEMGILRIQNANNLIFKTIS